ncbi:hypothetical protein EYF80_063444 [Liparis tanakae]|uniref:Uncharacterized protein n=1 Tax=Liparis tanakae TaxID=230148 RepID=A0A4Z2EC69_9TELE|nr:hypothetical protein EYF80_063444 [Liparis tanakae]
MALPAVAHNRGAGLQVSLGLVVEKQDGRHGFLKGFAD